MDSRLAGGVSTAAGRLFRGGHFLGPDPEILTYYGPGQPPNAAPGFQLNSAGSEVIGRYIPPSEWMIPGSLLRRPQVAWLTLALPYSATTYDFEFAGADVSYSGGQLVEINDSGGTGGGDIGAAGVATVTLPPYGPVTLDHPEVAEHDRLRSAMLAAKATIEALRPGRTWVALFDWYDPAWGRWAYPMSANVLHLTAPSLFEVVPYFGTEFVHVFCGAPVEDRRLGFNDWLRVLQDAQGDWAGVSSLSACASRLIAAEPTFGTYRIVVFAPDAGSSPPDPYPTPPGVEITDYDYPPLPPTRPLTPGDIYVETPFDPDDPAWVFPPGSGTLLGSREAAAADADAQAAAFQATLDTYADQTAGYYGRSASSFAACHAALGPPGSLVRVAGTYRDVTARSLVEAVASALGFSPDSGLDL